MGEPIDLLHGGAARSIGVYLVRLDDGLALFDCGPASCLDALEAGLAERGHELADVRHLLLSHIHLDHAGAAGTLVRRNPQLQVHVSEIGAPHLVDPSRLERSARRLYGDSFDPLWGELAPVPEGNVHVVGERVLGLECFPSPGHASHHVCYFDGTTLYAGDAAGVRIQPARSVLPPTPPPDVDLGAWEGTLGEIERRRAGAARADPLRARDGRQRTPRVSCARRLATWAERVQRGASEDEFVAAAKADLPRGRRGRLRSRDALLAVVRRAGPVLGATSARDREPRAARAHREFRLLFTGRATTILGSAMAPGSRCVRRPRHDRFEDRDLGLVLAARRVPQLLFLLVGGIWADRLPRHP